MAITLQELAVVLSADPEPLKRAMASGAMSLNQVAEAAKKTDVALEGVAAAERKVAQAATQQAAQSAAVSAAITRNAAATQNLAKQGAAAAAGLNSVRGALTSMAGAALSTAPGVAPLAGILGSMAIGTPLMIGVLAGGAAVGLLWQRWTREANEARQATDAALASLEKLANQGTPAMERLNEVMKARADLARLEMERINLNKPADTSVLFTETSSLGGGTGLGQSREKALQANAAEIARLKALITAGQEEINRIHAAGAARLDADRLADQKKGEKEREDANEQHLARVLKQIERFEQRLASMRSSFRGALGSQLAGDGTFGPQANYGNMVALGGVSVKNAGAGGGAGASAASQALAALGQSAAAVVAQFQPMALFGTLLSSAFAAMQPSVEALLMPVRVLGQLLGGVVNRALSYLAEGIGYLIKGIGWAVDKLNLFGGDGGIGKFGQELIDSARAARRATTSTEQLAEAAKSAANSITNNPAIFDWALRRRQAGMGGSPESGGSTGGGGPTSRPSGPTFIFNGAGHSVESFKRDLRNALQYDAELKLLVKRAAA